MAKGLENWIVETPPHPDSRVTVENGKLLLDVADGATVYFKEKLSGNVMFEYTRKVLVEQGLNGRLSDFNQFWMTIDLRNENLFTRTGVFSEYDPLLLYYVGLGGNDNSTTRFRKYTGTSDQPSTKNIPTPGICSKLTKNTTSAPSSTMAGPAFT